MATPTSKVDEAVQAHKAWQKAVWAAIDLHVAAERAKEALSDTEWAEFTSRV